jgi:hypothetical protein
VGMGTDLACSRPSALWILIHLWYGNLTELSTDV